MSIQSEIDRIVGGKTAIATAIEGKGVTVPDGTLLDGMAPLIESIEAGSGGVQPDWNQNDSTQPDYIKNRPFYTGDPVETILVEESTIAFAENRGLYVAEFPSTFEATVGETYKVYWDGAAYECTCVNSHGSLIIGNFSIIGDGSDTGEPFVMLVRNGVKIKIGTADTSASHTVSISRFAQEVVKIDKKYLVQPDWNQNDSTQPDYVKNRPFYTGNPVETVLVEESTVTFAENRGLYMADFPSTFEATVGETYKVSWDGAAYECACVIFSDMLAIGNLSIMGVGSDTGEPFVMVVDNGKGISIVTADTSASHTFSISSTVVIVVKIDEKYLPENVATKAEVEVAQNTADNAQTTANNAQTTANSNKEVLYSAFSSDVTFTFDKQTSGRDTFVFNAYNYYKISDFNPAPEDVISFKGTRENGVKFSEITIGSNCVEYGLFIVVASAGVCSLPGLETTTISFTSPSAGLYARYEEGNQVMTAGTGQFTLIQMDGLTIKSSTANSTKKFRITVDDSGTITATEVS